MDIVGHDDVGVQNHNNGDGSRHSGLHRVLDWHFFALEPGGAATSFVKIAIQPDERLTDGEGAGRGESDAWQTAVQMPGQE